MKITVVFGGFEGESYADIPTVKQTVGLVPPETRAARLKEMKEIADFAAALGRGRRRTAHRLRAARRGRSRFTARCSPWPASCAITARLKASGSIWRPARSRPTRC